MTTRRDYPTNLFLHLEEFGDDETGLVVHKTLDTVAEIGETVLVGCYKRVGYAKVTTSIKSVKHA